ncbi:MAG: 3-hydroxyacyl-CoA dehydrogenase NAD-binding domain-containing protein [Acidobacteriota bacterium]
MSIATELTAAGNPQSSAFRLEEDGDLAVVWFDLPGEKVNKFSSAVMLELDALVDVLAGMSAIKRLVFASAKSSIFIAGADITEFTKVTSAMEAEKFTRFGQQVFSKISRLPQVTVGAVNGPCLGGGTELLLNLDYRVIADDPRASIALPETKLGIFPAWTGTTRLPRLIGLTAALDMILTGKTIDARRAKKIGLVDEVIPAPILLEGAKAFVRKMSGKREGHSRTHIYIEGNPIARKVIFNQARKSVIEKTGGHYPAPLKAIDVMELGFQEGFGAGLAAEAKGAAELIMGETAQNLVRLFFMMEDSKKDAIDARPVKVTKAGVLGAGVMGGGIAQLVVDKAGIDVRMKDINWSALAGGMKAASKLWRRKVERRRMTRWEMARSLSRISSTVEWTGFHDADLVVEAVVESLAVKQQVLGEFEKVSAPGAIFASNTSTIPISNIAANAERPENVVGMHFFNPVDRMPLVEVIRGAESSDRAVVTVAAFARKLGKTVVHCNDAPGFVVNRILAPYMNEAAFLLEEGYSIESIDKAMTDFGMPMGPLALLDEVGLDVAAKAGHIMAESFPERMQASGGLQRLLEDKRLGKKVGRGLYQYKDGKRTEPDSGIYKLLSIASPREGNGEEMTDRMILAMVNEASTVLADGVVASAEELDLAMIMGTGFPPFRGGLLRYADKVGLPAIVVRLEELAARIGPRFTPSSPLRELAGSGNSFYGRYQRIAGITGN